MAPPMRIHTYSPAVKDAYTAQELETIGCGNSKAIRKKATNEGFEYKETIVSGNIARAYLFNSLPPAWRFKIERHEDQKLLAQCKSMPAPEERPLIAPLDIEAQARLKQFKIDHAQEIEDEWERKQHYLALFNTVRGSAQAAAYAKFEIIQKCQQYLEDNGHLPTVKKEKATWNHKAVKAFCSAYVAGEIEVAESTARIFSAK